MHARAHATLHRVRAVAVLGVVTSASQLVTATGCGRLAFEPIRVRPFAVEHPSGSLEVEVDVEPGDPPRVRRSAVIRTARALFDGTTFPRPRPSGADDVA